MNKQDLKPPVPPAETLEQEVPEILLPVSLEETKEIEEEVEKPPHTLDFIC